MATYSVYREYTSGRDGDKGFDTLADAERDFDDAAADSTVVRAELIDNSGAEPVTIKTHVA